MTDDEEIQYIKDNIELLDKSKQELFYSLFIED
jgi:hypothetical protein